MDTSLIYNNIPNIELEMVVKQHNENYLNSIFHGDNLSIMKNLLNYLQGSIDLVYIDPPFGTNQDFIAYDGKTGYSDKITNEEFLEFLRKRLFIIRELMSSKGSIISPYR
jgi:adenine-specific DNA-methyltransferase